mgnify:FL=1
MKEVEKLFIPLNASILQAMEVIDRGAVQIALVVDEEKKLLGTVTDGDVRRAILRGVELSAPVTTVMNRQPKTAKPDMDREVLLTLMRYLNLRQFPVVDENNRVIGLILLDELIQQQSCDNWVVLMAGGLGTRLGELTRDCPKPLLKVGSKPILEVILDNFITSGFRRFYISVNYKAEMIRDYFGDGTRWGVEIRYLHENKRLGTAGALSLIPLLPDEPLIVMNGDLLTKVNFRQLIDFHTETGASATMCVREYELQVPYGVVKVDHHRLIGIEEKPVHKFFINGGIYILNPEILELIPKDTYYDMPELFGELMRRNLAASVFPIHEYWIDIGRRDDFEKANMDVYQEGFL